MKLQFCVFLLLLPIVACSWNSFAINTLQSWNIIPATLNTLCETPFKEDEEVSVWQLFQDAIKGFFTKCPYGRSSNATVASHMDDYVNFFVLTR